MTDKVIKVEYYTWKTVPPKLKQISIAQGHKFTIEDGVIAVNTIWEDEDIKNVRKLDRVIGEEKRLNLKIL
jgi:hypothetical protein